MLLNVMLLVWFILLALNGIGIGIATVKLSDYLTKQEIFGKPLAKILFIFGGGMLLVSIIIQIGLFFRILCYMFGITFTVM
jgi:hypothetical protein